MPLSLIFPAINAAFGLIAFFLILTLVGKVKGSINSISWSLIMLASLIFSLKYLIILLSELNLIYFLFDIEITDLVIILLLLIAAAKLNLEMAKLVKKE